jgi:hypothetical protein
MAMRGKKLSEEHKRKISEALRGNQYLSWQLEEESGRRRDQGDANNTERKPHYA